MLEAKREIPDCFKRGLTSASEEEEQQPAVLWVCLGHDLAGRGILLEDCKE